MIVCTVPSSLTRRRRRLFQSMISRRPLRSKRTSIGKYSEVSSAGRPSPSNCALPVPATVQMWPTDAQSAAGVTVGAAVFVATGVAVEAAVAVAVGCVGRREGWGQGPRSRRGRLGHGRRGRDDGGRRDACGGGRRRSRRPRRIVVAAGGDERRAAMASSRWKRTRFTIRAVGA
jgi:hypothetical protein